MTGWSKAYALKRASLDHWEKLGTKPQQWSFEDVVDSSPASASERIAQHLVTLVIGRTAARRVTLDAGGEGPLAGRRT